MTVPLAAFRAEFPEMDLVPDSVVQAKLAEAHQRFSRQLYGAQYDPAVKYQTAILIAASPYGAELRIASGSVESLYHEPLTTIQRTIPATPLTIP